MARPATAEKFVASCAACESRRPPRRRAYADCSVQRIVSKKVLRQENEPEKKPTYEGMAKARAGLPTHVCWVGG